MDKLLISMAIGLAAGLLDVTPMILQKMDKRAIVSAFLQYVLVAIVILNISLPGLVWWLIGPTVSLAMAVPILIIVSSNDKKALPIIGTMAIVLGFLISLAGHFFL